MTKENKQLLAKKLEYRFKNSDIGKEYIVKLTENKTITAKDISLLINKLEYRFKNSDIGKSFIAELNNEK